jgi:hypothetical protein
MLYLDYAMFPPVPSLSFLEGTRNTFLLPSSSTPSPFTPSQVRKEGRRGDREEEISGRNNY